MEKEHLYKAKHMADQWKQLCKNFDTALFLQTFKGSFEVLRLVSSEFLVDKRLMPMIVAAYTFSKTEPDTDDPARAAAMVMTERMLHLCVTCTTPSIEPIDGTLLYSLETQEELYLDFINPEVALQTLIEHYSKF